MPNPRFRSALLGIVLWIGSQPLLAGDWDITGNVGGEARWFPKEPVFSGQNDSPGYSVTGNVKWRWRNTDGNQRASFKIFGRLDSVDSHRSHADVREAYWAIEDGDWALLVGLNKVFWGVTESRHLVDVINQTDLVEDPDQEQKLGQAMINLTLRREWGQLDLFVMPWFRERTYPGEEGRLRTPLTVDTDSALYESAAQDHHTAVALRWSHYFGDIDIGVHTFLGTGREPKLLSPQKGFNLVPFYHQISQLGVDLQYTRGAWLWKLEAIVRDGLLDTYLASSTGFEYTFYGVSGSSADVGFLMEYLYDGRGTSEPVTPFDDDIFIGSRLTFNDMQNTNLLAGVTLDQNLSDYLFNVELERRFGENITAELRLRLFNGAESTAPLYAFNHDDYLQISISRHF